MGSLLGDLFYYQELLTIALLLDSKLAPAERHSAGGMHSICITLCGYAHADLDVALLLQFFRPQGSQGVRSVSSLQCVLTI